MNTSGQNGTLSASLTPRQLRAVAAILDTPSMDAAARRARVGRSTLYSWLRDAAFREELTRRQSEVFDTALARLKCLVGDAVQGLGDLVGSADERVKRSACRDVLDVSLKVKELHEIEERLAAIEKHLEGGKHE
jgi:transposase-like protein